MSPGSEEFARNYLASSQDGFWSWSDDGESIELLDGVTVAFRQQLLLLLPSTFRSGLPRFELIVLLLAACRGSGSRLVLQNYLRQFAALRRSSKRTIDLLDALEQLSTLPASQVWTIPGLRAILQLATEGLDCMPPDGTEPVLRILGSRQMVIEHVAGVDLFHSLSDRARELERLKRNLWRINEENVRRLMTTGHVDLPETIAPESVELPEPAPVEPSNEPEQALSAAQLLRQLEQRETHANLARLVREIRAAVSFPRQILPGDDLGLGGVSDLTNRGEPDRLLLSELAQDSDVLTIRVALQEALYLRRESPPSPPAVARALLIDHGLRMWGQPRFLAVAVMLALMADHETHGALRLFRSLRGQLEPVRMGSVSDLEQHVAALDPLLHAGDAIEAFAAACRENLWEPLFITCEESYADEEFRRPLREAGFGHSYMALVNRDGALRLISRSRMGEKQLRAAVFDLNRRRPERVLPVNRPEATDRVRPAIEKRMPFPLHLSCDQPPPGKLMWLSEFHRPGVAGVTADRRLVFWDSLSEGGPRQILDKLPPGTLHWWGLDDGQSEELHAIIGEPSHGSVFLVRAPLRSSNSPATLELMPAQGLQSVTIFQGSVFLILKKSINVFSLSSGELACTTPRPDDLAHVSGRFFQNRRQTWQAMSFDGRTVRFDDPGFDARGGTLFDCQPLGRPIMIDLQGRVFASGSNTPLRALPLGGGFCRVKSVTRDGREARIQELRAAAKEWILTFPDGLIQENPPPAPPQPQVPALRQFIRRLTQVGVANGELSLRTKTGRWMTLALSRESPAAIQLVNSKPLPWSIERSFDVDILRGQGYGYTLRPAKFADGSCLLLDSRGLLHFQSSDRRLPEFSVVLEEHPAGWVADGRVWGNPWHLGASRSLAVDPSEIWTQLIVPFVARLA